MMKHKSFMRLCRRSVTLFSAGMLSAIILGSLLTITGATGTQKAHAATPTAAPMCDTGYKLLGIIPTWYAYFGDDYGLVKSNNKFVADTCGIVKGTFTDHFVQVGLAIIDMLLRVGALVAAGFVVMGGYKYMSSQGEPKNIEEAMATIINSAIGLGIVVTAAALVAFIGNRLGG